jgi:hypothetical protein
MSKLEDFGGEEATAAEYSNHKSESQSNYRGGVRSPINNNWAPISGPGIPNKRSIKE